MSNQEKHTQYVELANNIHEVIILKGTRQAVDEMFDLFMDLHDAAPDKSKNLYFLITHQAESELPINHVLMRTRKDKAKWGNKAYTSNLTRNVLLANVVRRLLSTLGMGGNESAFFPMDEREQAIAWLIDKRREEMMMVTSPANS